MLIQKEMKTISGKIYMVWRSVTIAIVLIIALMFTGCELQKNFTYVSSNPTAELNMNAWEFIQMHDTLQMFEQVISYLEMESYFYDDSTRTFIAPTNFAFTEYLSENGYSSIEDVPVPILRNVVKYHLVNARVTFTDPELSPSNNPIAYTAENGQIMYLSHDGNYIGLVNQGTNQSWSIITSNLEPTNGVMHVIAYVVYYSADGGSTTYDTGATGVDNFELVSNTGFSLESGGDYVLNTDALATSGTAAENIIYELDAAPANGWLFKGPTMLQTGDKFTQMDIDVMNMVYINDGTSSTDQISLSAHDRTGASKLVVDVDITIQ